MKNVLEGYLNTIQKIIYRSGPIQNIKSFNPRKPDKAHSQLLKNKDIIYASDDSSFAAGFCFIWSDKDGFKFGRYNNGPWTLEVPNKFKDRLNSECSMYELESESFKKFKDIKTPEFYSIIPVKVIKEIKFKSCYKCLNNYKVILKII